MKISVSSANQLPALVSFPATRACVFFFSVSLNHFFSADCNIAISTYSMVSFTGKRSWEAGEVGENSETACNAFLY